MATYMAGVLKVSNLMGERRGEYHLSTQRRGGGMDVHDLGHLLAVGLGVERGLGEQHGVLLGGDAELVVEGVVPDLLHVVPVGHDAVLDGVLEGEDTTLGLGLIADVGVLLAHADHDAGVARAADDRREHGARGVVTGKAGFAHARTVVDDQSLNFVSHCWLLVMMVLMRVLVLLLSCLKLFLLLKWRTRECRDGY
jgi:hypothetical protein